jgi:hypothetical protein
MLGALLIGAVGIGYSAWAAHDLNNFRAQQAREWDEKHGLQAK